MDASTYRMLLAKSAKEGITLSEAIKQFNQQRTERPTNVPAPVKTRRRNKHEETNLQRECVAWFRSVYPKYAINLFHPNNEPFFGGAGKSKEQQQFSGYLAKTIGVTSGVADLILLVPNAEYHGLCIELKWEKGKQRDSQKVWQTAVESVGYKYCVIRNIFEFKRTIIEYLKT